MKYDVYLYEDCRVLKNKLNLKDEAELDKAESEFASISMKSIKSTIQTIITRRLTNISRENRAYSLITAS